MERNKSDCTELKLEINLIGQTIKKIRKAQNLNQEQLGNMIGVRKSWISKIEQDRDNISIRTIARIFAALHLKVTFHIDAIEPVK